MLLKKYFPGLILLLGLVSLPAAAAGPQAVIEDAWIADAPPVAKIRAAYLKLHNKGNRTLTVKAFSSPAFARIEMHQTILSGGMMHMQPVKHLALKPGESIEFKPGGYHLMLFDPQRRLAIGDQIKLQLQLADNTTTTFTAVVRQRGAHMHHHPQQH